MSVQASSSGAADASQAGHNDITTTPEKGQPSRKVALLPSFNSLGSFLASAGGLSSGKAGQSASDIPRTDAELMISDPTPTEWADELSPTKESFSARASSSTTPRTLSEEVRFRGNAKPTGRKYNADKQSSIAFPAPTPPTGPLLRELDGSDKRSAGSRTSSTASIARESESTLARFIHSPEPAGSTVSSSIDTPPTSVRDSPRSAGKDARPLPSVSPPPPSESTIKAEHQSDASTFRAEPALRSNQTLPRSFAASRSPASFTKSSTSDTNAEGSTSGTTSVQGGRKASKQLEEALESDEKTARRAAGLRARSINGLRGLAAAWVPARFNPASLPTSSASSSASSNDDDSSLSLHSTRRRDGMALVTTSNDKTMVRHGANDAKRPVKLDRRRLDKAVSLAVEAAQAAEEDERLWEEKRAKRAAQKESGNARPAFKSAGSGTSQNSKRQVARVGGSDLDADLISDEEEEEDEDDLGFSLDLYISSLGYLIAAISDKEASGLNDKQKQDIQKRLEEGMSKLGFDAKAELEQAQALKRELELEREKLKLQREVEASPANVIHHHYHTAMPSSSMFGDATFSRAHAAAKASSRGSSSLAGKISSSVLDVGLHIGAGALSALSANLSAIAPGGGSRKASSGSASSKASGMEDPRITDLDNDEDLKSMAEAQAAQAAASQPGSGAATPRTAWTRAISQNNKQWELAVAFASTAASALASSLGAVARDGKAESRSTSTAVTTVDGQIGNGPLTHEQQVYLAKYGHLDGAPASDDSVESAEDRLILLSASLARSLKRSPLPTQLYQLLRQLVSILAAIDSKYSLTEKGTQLAVRETSRAMRFVRRHDLHVKAVRVAWAAAEAAVAALEAYRDERGWMEVQQQQRLAAGTNADGSPYNAILSGGTTPLYSGSPPKDGKVPLAIEDRTTLEAQIDDAEAKILKAAQGERSKKKVGVKA